MGGGPVILDLGRLQGWSRQGEQAIARTADRVAGHGRSFAVCGGDPAATGASWVGIEIFANVAEAVASLKHPPTPARPMMDEVASPLVDESVGGLEWYVYDRDGDLLRVAKTLPAAEAWALRHWKAVEVASRQQIADHDYWYLLLASPTPADAWLPTFRSRDNQARIMRTDRVDAIARDPNRSPATGDSAREQ